MCQGGVGVLSQLTWVLKKPHFNDVRRMISFPKVMLKHGLFYAYEVDVEVCGCTNANWVGSTHGWQKMDKCIWFWPWH